MKKNFWHSAYPRILLGILLLQYFTNAQEQTHKMETPLQPDTVINSYRLGFIHGKARGSIRRSYPMNCLAGCVLLFIKFFEHWPSP